MKKRTKFKEAVARGYRRFCLVRDMVKYYSFGCILIGSVNITIKNQTLWWCAIGLILLGCAVLILGYCSRTMQYSPEEMEEKRSFKERYYN